MKVCDLSEKAVEALIDAAQEVVDVKDYCEIIPKINKLEKALENLKQ